MENSTVETSIPGFNPFTQNITLLAADGITPITTTVAEIDAWRSLLLTSSISYAVQIGASFLMLIVVILLTQPAKRTTPLFCINTVSLLLSGIENTLIVSYYPSEWTEFYTWFTYDNSFVPQSTVATNVAANTLGPIFLFAIECSLLLQTRVICDTMKERYRWVIMGLSVLVAMVAVGFNFGQMVMNNIVTFNLNYYSNPAWNWIGRAVDISYTFSIWYFCFIFVSKLAITMWKRKQMGMKQWGPMKIICIMGGCTMIIPSIFSILEFYSLELIWEPGPIGHTLVAIMLPLSSIWATASLEGRLPNGSSEEARSKQFFGSYASTMGSGKAPLNKISSSATHMTSGGGTLMSSTFEVPFAPNGMDVEAEAVKGKKGKFGAGGLKGKGVGAQVMVERTYSVSSYKGLDGLRRD